MIRVFLADDHALVLEGLRSLLESEGDIVVVGTASDGDQVLEPVRALRPDVVVLDLQMPQLGGIACLQQIRAEGLPAKVLVLSAFYDGDTIQSALEAEADGFALKTEPPQQTVTCIRQVYQGQLVFPQAARRWLRQQRQRPDPAADLSEREAEVLGLVAQGLTNTQIAQRLVVSENTVKFHLQNIYQKLGVSNRTEAAGILFKQRREGWPRMIYLLFALAALLLLGLIALIWRLWNDYAHLGPAEEEREREIASLNDAQANRVSDQQLTHPPDADSAWQTMVQRGTAGIKRRPTRRPPRR